MAASLCQRERIDAAMQRTAAPLQRTVWSVRVALPTLGTLELDPDWKSTYSEMTQMRHHIVSVLIASVFACGSAALADSHDARSKGAVDSDVAAIRQLGKDMGDAMVAGDVEKLDQIFADDWASVASSGKVITKEDFLRNHVSGAHKLESFELGPIDVQVLGNSAVAEGGVIETRGNETNVEMIYADLLEKRDGKWVVVRSIGGKAK
jgi:uncharacterized protein (TIGR02246 family)